MTFTTLRSVPPRAASRTASAPDVTAVPSPAAAGFRERVYAWILRIPRGRVATYGQIARLAGAPPEIRISARHVGQALANPPPGLALPWHRVINAQGRISIRGTGGWHAGRGAGHRPGGAARRPRPRPGRSGPEARQRRLLEAEGVRFVKGRVDLDRYRWDPALGAASLGDSGIVGPVETPPRHAPAARDTPPRKQGGDFSSTPREKAPLSALPFDKLRTGCEGDGGEVAPPKARKAES